MKLLATLLVSISMLAATASAATAADSIYYANYNGASASISVANLDGSGAGRDLFTNTAPRGAAVSAPSGLTLDPAAGYVYWGGTASVSRGSIDSCDAAATCATNLYPLPAGGPPATYAGGPALDQANGLMYYMDFSSASLIRTSLDGSGAVNDTVNTTGATALGGGGTGGIAIDKRTNRIYWTNDDFAFGKISWANLDGSGGGDLNTTGANMGRPWGLALDTVANRIYWTSYEGSDGDNGSVSFASLDNSGGGNLYTSASLGCGMLDGPNGVAIDRAANKIYWANYAGNTLSSANLDGSGGCADIGTAGATMAGPDEVAVLKAPAADAASTLSRTSKTSNVLSCTAGAWNAGAPEANFFRSPRSIAYQWKKAGVVIAGATAATYTPTSSGAYTCAAVATNSAGSTTGPDSTSLAFKRAVGFAKPKFKRKTSGAKLTLTGKVSPAIKPALSAKDCSGTVKLKFALKKKTITSKSFKLKYKKRKCSAAASLKIAKKYAGKKVKLTISIGRSTKLTAAPKTVSLKL